MATVAESQPKTEPALKLNFYSHATLECRDIAFTRKFFDEFLGFETVQMANVSFWARLGGDQIIVIVQGPTKNKGEMPHLNHNGLDVATEADVDAAYQVVLRDAEKWGLHKITKPTVQHGTYVSTDADVSAALRLPTARTATWLLTKFDGAFGKL